MPQAYRHTTSTKRARLQRSFLLGFCGTAFLAGSASAAVIGSSTILDFSSSSVSFGYDGSNDFTFTDVSGGIFFNPTAVGVSTSGSGAVSYSSFFATPDTYFDPVRGSGILTFDGSSQFAALPSRTGIPYSASPFFIGLRDQAADGVHYGYGEFYGTELVSYAFETEAGLGIRAGSLVSPVPLPASAPMFGAAVALIGFAGYRRKRRAIAPTV